MSPRDSRQDAGATKVQLLRHDSAGNAIARVSRRVGLHVVLFGMNDQRGSTIAEKRMAIAAISQIDVSVSEFHGGFAVGVDGEVHHVASVMAFGILQAVLFAVWIEVRSGRLEIGTIALGVLMKVDAVRARGQIVQLYIEYHPRAFRATLTFRQCNCAHALALGIFHFNHSFCCAGERAENDGERYRSDEQLFVFHGPEL
jgi:hypothetical protein